MTHTYTRPTRSSGDLEQVELVELGGFATLSSLEAVISKLLSIVSSAFSSPHIRYTLSLQPPTNSQFPKTKEKSQGRAMSFSATHPLQLNTAIAARSNDKLPSSLLLTKTPSFLGSTRKLRPSSLSAKPNHPNAHRRSAVVSVSEAVKEKKASASTNLVSLKFHFFIEFALGKFCFAMHGERIGFRNLVLFFSC